MRKKALLIWTSVLVIWTCLLAFYSFPKDTPPAITASSQPEQAVQAKLVKGPVIGDAIDRLNEVPIYFNGGVRNTSGRSESADGYNYGLKWQCVEFVKRYYYDHLRHRMPNTWGHAREFFNMFLNDADLNTDRGLYQFRNGSSHKPRLDDIIVFSADQFGHVAIISEIGPDYIEVAQQNVSTYTRERYDLTFDNGRWRIRDARVLGWLSKYRS